MHEDDNGWTPLMIACVNGHAHLVELFLKMGANAKSKDKEGRTATQLAEMAEQQACVAILKCDSSAHTCQ